MPTSSSKLVEITPEDSVVPVFLETEGYQPPGDGKQKTLEEIDAESFATKQAAIAKLKMLGFTDEVIQGITN